MNIPHSNVIKQDLYHIKHYVNKTLKHSLVCEHLYLSHVDVQDGSFSTMKIKTPMIARYFMTS